MSQNDNTNGETVTCENGHEYHHSDLDKVGMNYHCPECFAVVDAKAVSYATMGKNA